MQSHPYLLHRQCCLIPATLFQLFGRLHIKTVLSGRQFSPLVISVWSLPVSSNSHLFRTILPAEDNSTDSFSAPSGFFDSAPRILVSSTQSSGFLSHGHAHAVCFTQRLVGACCGLLVVLMAIHELLCVVARPRPSWSLRAAPVQSRSHVHLPSILWIHVVCSACSVLLHGSDSS